MSKVMFSLPNQLVMRMKASIPPGERSEVVSSLLEKEIISREKKLYTQAMELETHDGLRQEMANWDAEFGNDGLGSV